MQTVRWQNLRVPNNDPEGKTIDMSLLYLLGCFWWRSERRNLDGWNLLSGLGTGVVGVTRRYKHQPAPTCVTRCNSLAPLNIWKTHHLWIFVVILSYWSTVGISATGNSLGTPASFMLTFRNPKDQASSMRSCEWSYVEFQVSLTLVATSPEQCNRCNT